MWESIDIGGRSADVFTPADWPRFVLLFLPHFDGVTLKDNPVWTALLAANRFACVCPDGGESWWSDRICPSFDATKTAESYLLEDALSWSLARFAISGNAIALAGVGSGGQGALRLGFKHPVRFRVVAAMEAALDHYELYGQGSALDDIYPSREHCRQDGAGLHIHPSNWPPNIWFACDPDSPWLRGNDRLHEKLMALGVPHTTDFTSPACGHSWTYYDRHAATLMRFIVEGLERESRRLV
jgi:S-formylglutathione hydrolase FrmB